MSISTLWTEFTTWWKGTSIGTEIDTAGKATLTELEAVAPAVLESVTASTATALLTGITAGSSTSAIIAAGIDAAENGFKAAGASVAATTVSTFTAALHSSVVTQTAVGSVTPVTPATTA